MEEASMEGVVNGIRKFYEVHCELMKTMIPAVEAVERLASAESSNDSESTKSRALAIDAPQEYTSLPTVHIAETATCHISAAIEAIRKISLSDVKMSQSSVRPLLDRLNHLLTICELHHLEPALLACGEAAIYISKKTDRPCDAAFFAARVALFLCSQRPARGESRSERLRELTAELQTDGDAGWPEFKLIVVQIARFLSAGFLTESEDALREAYEALGAVDQQHGAFFTSKVKEAVLSRAVLLQAKLLLRLKVGPLLPARDETPLDAALLLRRLGYSLVRFHFDRMNKAPQPKKASKDRHQDESWQAVTLLMSGCFWTCWTHTFVGANREARCYLREYMKFAQTYYLPYRAHSCLLLQAHLDLHGKLESYRPVRLAQMRHVLTDQTLPKRFSAQGESSEGEEEEENFLHYRESPRVVRDEHLPDPQRRTAHGPAEFGASPVLPESEQDESDLYAAEEPRLAWLRSAVHALKDSSGVKEALGELVAVPKRAVGKKAEDGDIAHLISLVSDLHTPSTEADTKTPGAPRKNFPAPADQPSRVTRQRAKRGRPKAAKGETFDAEGVARMCSHLSQPAPSRRGRAARVLVDSSNVTPSPEAEAEVTPEEEIEFCPTARFVPRNLRIARRLELQRHVTAAERVRSSAEPLTGESLLPLAPDGLPVLESKRTGIDPGSLAQLQAAFLDLRWFPPTELFRTVCHRLAAHFLLIGDNEAASYYLSQAVFVAMKQTYQSNLVQKLRRGVNAERWERALHGCRSAFADITSWRAAVDQLPSDWTILQFSCVEDDSGQLVVTRLQANSEPASRVCPGFSETGLSLLGEFDVLMQDNIDGMSLTTRKEWWESRYRINEGIADWAERCRGLWFPGPLLAWMLAGSGPLILILDRRLNSLPFELILHAQADRVFTRMTNLAVVLAHFNQIQGVLRTGVDLKKAFYVLNPDKDLDGTQVSLQPVFDSFGWAGLVGQQPKEEDLLAALNKYDLLAYCGHGSGTKYLHLQALQNSTSRALALLVGCSSGKLYPEGSFEPNGNVLSHIIAGSPSVLALLWDVTDRDIDRYFKKLLLDWWEQDSAPFGVLARQSRSACKLLYLVGCAPVLYGLPIDKSRK